MPDFSICVPTHNRATLLPRLFANLGEQRGASFELVIVNDGSTDDTQATSERLAAGAPFPTVVLNTLNRGKGAALNEALDAAKGRFFFIMDDDDQVVAGALARALQTWESISEPERYAFAGVCGLCQDEDGKTIGHRFPSSPIDDDFFSMRMVRGVRGDKREVVLRSAVGAFRFPLYDGEKRTPANILWIDLARQYKLRFVNDHWLIKEYRPDGMSANALKQKVASARSMANYYGRTLAAFPAMPLPLRFRFMVNHLRFAAHSGEPLARSIAATRHTSTAIMSAPLALLIAWNDRRLLAGQDRRRGR